MDEVKLTKREKRELAKTEKNKERDRQVLYSRLKKFFFLFVPLIISVWIGYKAYRFITEPVPDVLSQKIEVSENDWVKGDSQAAVTLIEYGDFQCPACSDYYFLTKKLMEEFPSDLKVVYRHYPLIQSHKKAYDAAKASEAAGVQGKFWEMHDILFEKQTEWANASNHREKFFEYAKELGFDEEKFKSDFENKDLEAKINNDLSSGTSMGINSTPTFFLNGNKVQPRSYDSFKKLIEDNIKGYTVE